MFDAKFVADIRHRVFPNHCLVFKNFGIKRHCIKGCLEGIPAKFHFFVYLLDRFRRGPILENVGSYQCPKNSYVEEYVPEFFDAVHSLSNLDKKSVLYWLVLQIMFFKIEAQYFQAFLLRTSSWHPLLFTSSSSPFIRTSVP